MATSAYRAGKHQEVLQQLPLGATRPRSQRELYLQYKALYKLKQWEQATEVLNALSAVTWGQGREVVFYERLELLNARGENSLLLKEMASLPQEIDNGFLQRRMRGQLLNALQGASNQPALAKSLQAVYQRFPEFERDTRLLHLLYNTIPKDDPRRNQVLMQLWSYGDVTQIPLRVQEETLFIQRDLDRYLGVLQQHFEAQYEFQNYTYLRTHLPRFLYGFRQRDAEAFKVLRRLYFNAMFKSRQYALGSRVLESEANQLFFDFEEGERLLWGFRFALKQNHLSQAAAARKELADQGYVDEVQEATWELAEFYRNNEEPQAALLEYNQMELDRLPPARQAAVQWERLMMYHQAQQRAEMIRIAAWALKFQFADDSEGAKFCYWTHKLRLIKDLNVLDCYKKYPFTYYGLKAKEVSSRFKQAFAGDLVHGLNTQRRTLLEDEQALLQLLELLYQMGEEELADSILAPNEANLGDLTLFHAKAALMQQQERYYLLNRVLAKHYERLTSDEFYGKHFILPLNYPLAFQPLVERYADKAGVSELLVYAVMREESRFRPYVKSPVGAVGLLQLMPATARYMGQKQKVKVSTHELVEPEINLHLGAAYLRYLLDKFDGNQYYTLAAYNGGATHVARWRKATEGKDVDYFVEGITFSETRNYVKRVMKSYYLYQSIYGRSY